MFYGERAKSPINMLYVAIILRSNQFYMNHDCASFSLQRQASSRIYSKINGSFFDREPIILKMLAQVAQCYYTSIRVSLSFLMCSTAMKSNINDPFKK